MSDEAQRRQRASVGGYGRAAKMTAAERAASARHAAEKRWEAHRAALADAGAGRGREEPSSAPTPEELAADPFLAEALDADPGCAPEEARQKAAILRRLYLARIDLEQGRNR